MVPGLHMEITHSEHKVPLWHIVCGDCLSNVRIEQPIQTTMHITSAPEHTLSGHNAPWNIVFHLIGLCPLLDQWLLLPIGEYQ